MAVDSEETYQQILRALADLRDGRTQVLVVVSDTQHPVVLSTSANAQALLRTVDRLATVGQNLLVEANERRPAMGQA